MYPKLYHSNETNFIHNGLGLLAGTISALATEELNGMFELNMEYDSDGFLADIIQEEMIIKAKANDKQDEQLFRIYSITKNHENDNLIIAGQHITYDLGNNFVEKLEALNLTKKQVMEKIGSSTAYSHPFNVTSSNTTTQSSTSLYRTNPLQMVGGMDGSVLQIWGGQIERDNFHLIMHDRRGSDDGVLVTYKKNLTGLTAKFDISNLVTRIFPYVFKEATNDEPEKLITVPGKYIDSPNINDYEMPYILPVDFAHEFDDVEEVTPQQLNSVASKWFVETGRDKPKVEMEVQFEHLWETEEYKDVAALELVGMGDTITVKHSKLKVEGTAIVNRIEYDSIARKNVSVDVGSVKASFTNKVNEVGRIIDRVDEIDKNANQAIKSANGKNTIYYGPDEPTTGNKDDIWFHVVDGEYTRTYRFDGIQWQRVIDKDVADIETVANDAHNRANQADATASLANQNALESLTQAQTSFDLAQEALSTGKGLTSRMEGIEDDISIINQTTESFATRIENAEGDISSLTQTALGLQNRVADAEGNISSVTQLANTLQTDLRNAEGDINTLTETASSMQRTISGVINRINILPYMELGGLEWATGEEYSGGTDRIRSPFIEVEPSTVLIFGIDGVKKAVSWFEYDDDKNMINVRQSAVTSITTGSSTKYIRLVYQESTDLNEKFQLEKGSQATPYVPYITDTKETQSQITQLSNNINARVQKGDVITQINLEAETGTAYIGGKAVILDGDTTVTGTFRVDNANITSVDAGKMTTGTLDAAQVSVINLSANSIVGGIIQSINSTTTFNLNNGNLSMENADFTLGGGADIHFTSSGNRLYFQRFDSVGGITRSAGFGVGTSINNRFPYAFLGTTNTTKPNPRDQENFTGFIANTRGRQQADGIGNSVVGHIFHIRDEAVSYSKGLEFDLTSNTISIHPMNATTYDYDLGTARGGFRRMYFNNAAVIYLNDRINIRNKFDIKQGWTIDTSYRDGNSQMVLAGLNASDWFVDPRYYNLGSNSNRFSYIYLTYQPDVRSDERMKENIQDNVLGLDFIKDIETKTFQLINRNPNLSVEPIQYGIIAQQLRDTLINHGVDIEITNILSKSQEGFYGVQYSQLIAPTIRGLQDLDLKVDEGFTRLQSVIDDEVNRLRELIERQVFKIAHLEERVNKLEVGA